MSRVSPSLARRIDRLARHAHAFHRFAHHPLCMPYAGELVALGARRRVCRGCLAVVLGFIIGSSIGLSLPPHPRAEYLLGGLAALVGLTSLRLRLGKFVARFLPSMLGSMALAAALHRACVGDNGGLLTLTAGLLIGTCCFVAYRLRGPNRAACTRCPERLKTPCSGLMPIVRRERAFQRLSQRWIDAEQSGHFGNNVRNLVNTSPSRDAVTGAVADRGSQRLAPKRAAPLPGLSRDLPRWQGLVLRLTRAPAERADVAKKGPPA